MSADSESENANDEVPKQATLVSSEEVTAGEVKRWQFENLEQAELQQSQKIRQEVFEQLRKEVEPEVQEQATLIKRQAFEESQKKGYDEGFKQGVQAGKLEGRHQAEKDAEVILKPQVRALQDLAEFMLTPYQEMSEEVFKQLSLISIAIAEKIVEKELAHHQDWIIDVVHKAVERLPDGNETLEITVNPADKELLDAYVSEHERPWKLIADEQIQTGSCKIKQNASTVVNDWREQLDFLLEESYAVAESLASENSEQTPARSAPAMDNSAASS